MSLKPALLAALAALLPLGAAWAGETYEGTAYRPASNQVLYRESHWVEGNRHLVLYRCPDGKAFARKRIDRRAGAVSPDFELVDSRDGYRQGVRSTASGREVFVQPGAKAAVRRARLGATAPVIDAGFDAYVLDAWDKLAGGKALVMSFLVPSRLRAMDFKVRQVGSDARKRSFRLSLGAWYGGMLPRIDVDYTLPGRKLLRYRGISDIRDGDGGNLNVDIRFPPEKRGAANAAALAAVEHADLDGRCLR